MHTRHLLPTTLLLTLATTSLAQTTPTITPIPAKDIHLTDTFWQPRLESLRTVTLPQLLQNLAPKLANFDHAAAALKGTPGTTLPQNAWDDADVYKALELASLLLASHPDPALDAQLDTLITRIAAAQEPDGYLYTPRTINPQNPLQAAGTERWQNEKFDSYELYNLACLIDAAIAHHQATGKTSLLTIAERAADLLNSTFGPAPKKSIWPGHPGIESALARLVEEAGTPSYTPRYTALAKFFLDQRGPDATAQATTAPATARGRGTARGGPARGPGSTYSLAQGKLLDQQQPIGHAPTALALYLGAAQVNDPAYTAAITKLADNLTSTRIYLSGAPASDNTGIFPRAYLLSSVNAYANSDAAASLLLLNQQLFLSTADAKYIDNLERTLYNALLASISLDGKTFFETQPLEFAPIVPGGGAPTGRGAARATRRDTFITANNALAALARLASVPELVYAQSADSIYINLYAQSTATIKQGTHTIKLDQQTTYPADGQIKLTVTPDQPAQFTLNLRLPAWARNAGTAGGLYSNAAKTKPSNVITLKLNGTDQKLDLSTPYATLTRQWSPGDTVELSLPMTAHFVQANDQLTDAKNRLAIKRGPILYCAEADDNHGKVRNLVLPSDTALTVAPAVTDGIPFPGGIPIVIAKAFAISVDHSDQRIRAEQSLIAYPYFAWANHGPQEMTTWFAAQDNTAVATSKPTLIATAKLSASPRSDGPTNPSACRDGIEPRASSDNSPLSHFDWWPSTNGKLEWVAAEWDTPQTLASTSVYWWDDSGVGECRPPTSWKAFYKDDKGEWQPVPTNDPFATDKDKYNRITFTTPLKTTGLKLECIMPTSTGTQRLSVGIQEWKIR